MKKRNLKDSSHYPYKEVVSIEEFIRVIREDTRQWEYPDKMACPWFRGEKNSEYSLIPSVLRKDYHETSLATTFQNRAATLDGTPDRGDVDKWLFLMQHVGLPTRLLDWTESALIALFFAVKDVEGNNPSVWMLHPLELNRVSGLEHFPHTWSPVRGVLDNFMLAFGETQNPSRYPLAVQPTYVHQRMFVQKGGFTVHGYENIAVEDIAAREGLLEQRFLKKYIIEEKNAGKIYDDLKTLGITDSTIFPEFSGLAREMKERFRNT